MGLLDRLADLLGFGSEEPAACSGADAPLQARSVPEGGWAAAMTSVVRDREEADRRAREEARLASDRNTSALLSDEEFIDWASREVLSQGLDFVRANRFGMTVDIRGIRSEAAARLARSRPEGLRGYDLLRVLEGIARRCNEELRGSPFFVRTDERGEYCERVLVFCRNSSIQL